MKIKIIFFLLYCIFISNPVLPDDKSIQIGTVEDGVSIFDLTSEGKKSWELHGTSARFVENGFVEIKNVQAVFYRKNDGKPDNVIINTVSAKVNQSSKLVTTDQYVQIRSNDITVVGEGMDGNMSEKTVQIKKDVKMTITGENKGILFSK